MKKETVLHEKHAERLCLKIKPYPDSGEIFKNDFMFKRVLLQIITVIQRDTSTKQTTISEKIIRIENN